jgi:hypothetical protein
MCTRLVQEQQDQDWQQFVKTNHKTALLEEMMTIT